MTTTWKRARRDDQIAHRRGQLLASARRSFAKNGFEGSSLNGIARGAGMAPGNVYRYFGNREEIFLHLILEEAREWVVDFTRKISRSKNPAKTWARAYLDRPGFMSLICQLGGVIETSVTEAALLDFKRKIAVVLADVMVPLERLLPSSDPKERLKVFHQITLLATGWWLNMRPNPLRDKIMARAEFAAIKVDHEEILVEGIRKMIDSTARRKKSGRLRRDAP